MSVSIDKRVVEMQFDNDEFQTRAAATLKSLDALNKGLKLDGATKGLQDLGAASKNVDVSHIANGVQALADKFKAMSVIGITALVSIAHQAIATGAQLVKSLTIAPVSAGFHEYETNLNSIQTILANTGLEGAAGLKRVTAALDELNHYSDQTIYNFSEMARNIGTFTAAGVKLDVATAAIKGIANLAAISGSNAEQASAAMYQLSQALAAGKLSLIDWNSVVNAGLGGKVFQDALVETARVHGVAIDKMIKDAGSFRASLEKGWITSDILTETLQKFTGDLNAQQLKQMGYTDQQIAGILKLGKTAQDAATKVKTFSQLVGTLQEAVGSGWAKTFQIIFGDFDEARVLFTGINDVIGGFINKSADARNKVLADWKELGGRTVLLEAIRNVFQAIIAVVTPIKDAFREFFPAATGKRLYDITVALRDFTEKLKIGADASYNLRRTFDGVFAVLSLGWDILKEGIAFFLRLFGVVTEGSGSILNFTGNVGDFLVSLVAAIRKGDGVHRFFQGLGDVLEPPIRLLKSLGELLSHIFDGFDGQKAAKGITGIAANLSPLEKLGKFLSNVWSGLFHILDNVLGIFHRISDNITDFLSGLGVNVSKSLQGINLQGIMSVITGGAFASFLLTLRGMSKNVGDIFDSITNSLGAMQHTLRAATLLQIALAIGVLATAVVLLSKVDAAHLASSMAAITVMFTQLLAAMLIFEKISGFKGFAKMPFVATSMILLGVAINVLALAVRQLATLNWDELGRGLTGVTILLGLVIATAELMPNPAGLISTGVGLTILAAGINVLVLAVTSLAGLSWEELAKGLIGVGTLLGALTLFTMFAKANATGVLSGAGIILLATGIKILASAVADMAKMSWAEIGRGMTVLAGALLGIGLALSLVPPTAPLVAAGFLILAPALLIIGDAVKQMSGLSWAEIGRGMTVLAGALAAIGLALALVPPTAPLTALGILIVASSLGMIGDAIKSMAQMGWDEIGRGLTVLAAALIIIGAAVIAMTGSLTGAAALLVVAASLAILTPILQALGQMSWEEIGKGLLTLAGVFVVLGVAGLALTALVPTLIGLGVAVTLLGAGVLLAGAGVFLFATALTALAIAGAAGTVALVAMIGALAGLIPTVLKQLGLGLVAFAEVIATSGPAFTAAMVAVLMAILNAIIQLTPKIIETTYQLLGKLLDTLVKYSPHLIDAGLQLVTNILTGFARNIGKVVSAATDLIVAFLKALGANQPRIIQAGVDLIINFVNGLADAIRKNSGRMQEAGGNLGAAIIEGILKGLSGGIGRITSMAADLAKKALGAAKNALGISSPSKEFFKVGQFSVEGMANGLLAFASLAEDSASAVGYRAIDAMKDTLAQFPDLLDDNLDIRPVITPVLDLSNVQSNAGQIGALVNGFNVTPSYQNALNAARGVLPAEAVANDQTSTGVPAVQFIQHNTSPKALSTADIYRNTRNQLSRARGGLPTP